MSESDSLAGVNLDRITRHADRRYVVQDRRPSPSFFDERRVARERYAVPARIHGRRYLDDPSPPSESELVAYVPRARSGERIEIEPGRRRRRRRGSLGSLERGFSRIDLVDREPSLRRRRPPVDIEIDEDLIVEDRFRRRPEKVDYLTVDRWGDRSWRGSSRGRESVSLERRPTRSHRRVSSTVRETSVHRYRREISPSFPRSLRTSPARSRIVVEEISPRPLARRRRSYSLVDVDRVYETRRSYAGDLVPSPRLIRAMMTTVT